MGFWWRFVGTQIKFRTFVPSVYWYIKVAISTPLNIYNGTDYMLTFKVLGRFEF